MIDTIGLILIALGAIQFCVGCVAAYALFRGIKERQ